MQNIYKNNIDFLRSITHLFYETLGEYQYLWFNLIRPVNPAESPLERSYDEGESVEGIQKKGHLFLSELYGLCRGDQSRGFNMYEIGESLGLDEFETEDIVENLSRAELIRHDKSSDKVSMTPYGIMIIKGEITVGYAPVH
jgi:hypothetical protein